MTVSSQITTYLGETLPADEVLQKSIKCIRDKNMINSSKKYRYQAIKQM